MRRRPWAYLALLAQVAALVVVLLAPQLQVGTIQVVGTLHHTNRSQVLSASGVAPGEALMTLDSDSVARHLLSLPWIRAAWVSTTLPGTVKVSVEEWQPVAAMQSGGVEAYLSSTGRAIDLTASAPGFPLLVTAGPVQHPITPGELVIDPTLLSDLVAIWGGFPAAFSGQRVTHVEISSVGSVTLVVDERWRVLLGQMVTPDQVAGLDQKLAALKSLGRQADLRATDLDYVNLMNPQTPTLKRKDPSPSPVPGVPSSAPTPSPRP
ncbi:MAG: cell division protein FtsQ/DivIB [Candidatus Dormibacteria bacterium]